MSFRSAITVIATAASVSLAAASAHAEPVELLHVLQGLPDREVGELVADYNIDRQEVANQLGLLSEEHEALFAANEEKGRLWKEQCTGAGALDPVVSLRCSELEEEGRKVRAEAYRRKADIVSAYVVFINENDGIDQIVKRVIDKDKHQLVAATNSFDKNLDRARGDLFDGQGAAQGAQAKASAIRKAFTSGLAQAFAAEGVGGAKGDDWVVSLAYEAAVQRMTVGDLVLVSEGYRTLAALVEAGPIGFADWNNVLNLLGDAPTTWGSNIDSGITVSNGLDSDQPYDRDNAGSRR